MTYAPTDRDGRALLPPMVNGKARRPSWVRDIPSFDDFGDLATFEYREDAADAGKALNDRDPIGWDTHPQYSGRWDLWTVTARRRSWSLGRDVHLMTDGSLRAIRSEADYRLTTPPVG